MRILGYIGLVALVPINAFGLISALRDGDLKGIGLMLFMAGMLTLFALTLRRGAKLERGTTHEKLAEGWGGESVTSFFLNVVLRSLEGQIFLAGALASATAAVATLLFPEAIAMSPARASVNAVLFGMWPIVSFAWYVKVCGPRYESGLFKTLLTIAVALFPFYVAYVRSAA
jgi:hypothetical protein